MSSSEISLALWCDNPAAELLVVDSDFKIIKKGSSPLTTTVAPGIYSLKAKIGAQFTEKLVMVEGEQDAHRVRLTAPEFESPMPLRDTRTSREYHEGSLDQFTGAGATHATLGEGSAIVLYVRDTSRRNFNRKEEEAAAYADNFKGFRLLDGQGEQLVNFDDEGKSTRYPLDGYMGARVRVAPGNYVLSWKRGGRETRLSLNTARAWALQVFLRLQPSKDGPVAMAPDFAEAAFAYDTIGTAYSAQRGDSRMLEAARLALLDRRNVVSGDMMRDILTGKFSNPMLGIYGGHMLAAEPVVDEPLFGTVVRNTVNLVGHDNPDAMSLVWLYESKTGKRPSADERPWAEILSKLMGPPLLVQSWDALVACAEASKVDIATLPAFRVAGHLAVSGITLTWEWLPPAPPRAPEETPRVPEAPKSAGLIRSTGGYLWRTVATKLLGRKADGTLATIPSLEIKVVDITTPDAAAEALRVLARKADWDKWLRLVHKDREKADSLATFTALQRDLILTLARAQLEPDIAAAIGAAYVTSVMQAHRVPLSTIAEALRGVDVIAVSAEVISRLKVAASEGTYFGGSTMKFVVTLVCEYAPEIKDSLAAEAAQRLRAIGTITRLQPSPYGAHALDPTTAQVLVALGSGPELAAFVKGMVDLLLEKSKKGAIKMTIADATIEVAAGISAERLEEYISEVKRGLGVNGTQSQ